jgi:hypothetical protein
MTALNGSARGTGVATTPDFRRRISCQAWLMCALFASGCGSGAGDSGGGGVSSTSVPDATGTASASGVPPGAFGGGEGKILFVEGTSLPKAVKELDLATRSIRTVVSPVPAGERLEPGLSRARDGTFIVAEHTSTRGAIIHHFRPDGSLIKSYPDVPSLPMAKLSPDGRSIAFTYRDLAQTGLSYPSLDTVLMVYVMDVQSGVAVRGQVLGLNDPPMDKDSLNSYALWNQQSELFVISQVGIHKIDRESGAASVLRLDPQLSNPTGSVFSPDGKSIYFEDARGNPYANTIWSIDLASGILTRRSVRSRSGRQFSPAFSPDGRWMLMQEVGLEYLGIAVSSYYTIAAVRLNDPPLDTEDLRIAVVDSSGSGITASGPMVWY